MISALIVRDEDGIVGSVWLHADRLMSEPEWLADDVRVWMGEREDQEVFALLPTWSNGYCWVTEA